MKSFNGTLIPVTVQVGIFYTLESSVLESTRQDVKGNLPNETQMAKKTQKTDSGFNPLYAFPNTKKVLVLNIL